MAAAEVNLEALIGNPVKDRSSHLYCNADDGAETIGVEACREGAP